MRSNNALQRTGEHRGRPVRAINGVRGQGGMTDRARPLS
jgi:hypothetical protein